ncbi:MAG: hypothetical protein EHM80_14260, partial [Nitrospiraceae bacterium]
MMSLSQDGALKALVRLALPLPLRKALWSGRQLLWQWLCSLRQRVHDRLPDRYVQASEFKRMLGRRLNLAAPTTFNEKLHWLMLYYR